jgi:hypothetical protein
MNRMGEDWDVLLLFVPFVVKHVHSARLLGEAMAHGVFLVTLLLSGHVT